MVEPGNGQDTRRLSCTKMSGQVLRTPASGDERCQPQKLGYKAGFNNADENYSSPMVLRLRQPGHDLLTAQEAGQAGQGTTDEAVFAFATAADRAVVTLHRRHCIRLHADIGPPDHIGWHSGAPERFARFPCGRCPAVPEVLQQPIIQLQKGTPPSVALLPGVQHIKAAGQKRVDVLPYTTGWLLLHDTGIRCRSHHQLLLACLLLLAGLLARLVTSTRLAPTAALRC